MIQSQPSRTALRVAMLRAAHQIKDVPRVLDDPVALPILGKKGQAALKAAAGLPDPSPLAPYLRAFLAARSRYAEERLAEAVERGVDQYVVLGAGLDTFAQRNPFPPERLRVFEVDHPATQAWKREVLQEAGLAVPPGLIFAPLDFEKDTLAAGLQAAGFDAAKPAFFSWLGVVVYLTREAIRETLSHIASLPPKSQVVFDFMIPRDMRSPAGQKAMGALAWKVEADGEPFQTFFDPAELREELLGLGFGRAGFLGAAEINRMYFTGREDGLKVGGSAHLMDAAV